MRGVLAQRPQVQLEVSLTGLDGLARIRASSPDLVLLDMHLPDIAGLELLRHLKSDAATAQIPVVIVSADALADQIQASLAAGASRYLTKPVAVSELLELIDDVLENVETRYG
jgi:CheY-like chemotaxis protein